MSECIFSVIKIMILKYLSGSANEVFRATVEGRFFFLFCEIHVKVPKSTCNNRDLTLLSLNQSINIR